MNRGEWSRITKSCQDSWKTLSFLRKTILFTYTKGKLGEKTLRRDVTSTTKEIVGLRVISQTK